VAAWEKGRNSGAISGSPSGLKEDTSGKDRPLCRGSWCRRDEDRRKKQLRRGTQWPGTGQGLQTEFGHTNEVRKEGQGNSLFSSESSLGRERVRCGERRRHRNENGAMTGRPRPRRIRGIPQSGPPGKKGLWGERVGYEVA